MLPIGSVLVDFDGTACLHDVAEHLLIEFADDSSWIEWDERWERGEIGSHQVILAQAAMLTRPTSELLAFALRHCPLDPTFAPFVRWLETVGVPVSIASDGFGFYIEPLLRASALGHLTVITNSWSEGGQRVHFENGHPECIGCGTCKMTAVLNARALGPVVYVGEGGSDRFGAIYSDVVFAKDALVDIARADGVPFLEWRTFDDVRYQLERLEEIPGAIGAQPCPGWRTA